MPGLCAAWVPPASREGSGKFIPHFMCVSGQAACQWVRMPVYTFANLCHTEKKLSGAHQKLMKQTAFCPSVTCKTEKLCSML